jgi:hypothetical protein
MIKKYLVLFFATFHVLVCFGQITIQHQPRIPNYSLDRVLNFTYTNLLGNKIDGQLSFRLTYSENSELVARGAKQYSFIGGAGRLSYQDFLSSDFFIGNGTVGIILKNRNILSAGQYNICIDFVPIDKNFPEVKICDVIVVHPLTQINLVSPMDEDSICNKKPMLNWTPLLSTSGNVSYRVSLVEKRQKSNVSSLVDNIPIFSLDKISTNFINFPAGVPELAEGKSYVWQVSALDNGIPVSTTEIWSFTVSCLVDNRPIPIESYRELRSLNNSNFYIANKYLKFSFLNDYNVGSLKFALYDGTNLEMIKIKKPEIKIISGQNLVDLDLKPFHLKSGHLYVIRFFPFNDQPVELRFTYHE